MPDKKISEIFKPNKRITIFVKDPNDPDSQTVYNYQSSVERLTAANLEILVPIRLGVPVFLNKNDSFLIRVQFKREVYEFTSSYLYKSASLTPVWIVQTPHDGKKIQQRQYIRIDFSVPVKVWLLDDFGIAINEPSFLVTKDISVAGLKIISKLPYSLASRVKLVFEIPDYGEINILGRVLRVQTFQHKNMMLFANAIEFFDINEKDFHGIDDFIRRRQTR